MTASAQTTRLPLLDTGRGLLILLVVLGHAIEPLRGRNDLAGVLYLSIYTFHMPAFLLISGYLGKADPPGWQGMRRGIRDLLLPYLIFETIWTLINWAVRGSFSPELLQPSWTLWFLLTLFCFRVMLPYLAQLRAPLTVSVIVSVASGYFASVDTTASLSRTLGFLPFFVLGWKLQQLRLLDRWQQAPTWVALRWRLLALGIITGTVATAWIGLETWQQLQVHRILFSSYNAFDMELVEHWWWVRPATLLLGTAMSLAVLSWMPRRPIPLGVLGQRSITVYLGHAFPIYALRESGAYELLPPEASLAIALLFALLLSLLLGTRFMHRMLAPLTSPRLPWLWAPEPSRI